MITYAASQALQKVEGKFSDTFRVRKCGVLPRDKMSHCLAWLLQNLRVLSDKSQVLSVTY
jgi:hypothetical protein